MHKTLLSLSILAALGLGGCGDKPANSPGVGTGTSLGSGLDNSEKQSLGKDRRISDQESKSASIQMPAWGLITEMARDFFAENKSGLEYIDKAAQARELLPILKMTIPLNRRLVEQETDPQKREALAKELQELEQSQAIMDQVVKGYECTDELGVLEAQSVNRDVMISSGPCGAALALADAIITASSGSVGWPRDIRLDVNRAAKWSLPYARLAEFTNIASAEIAKNIGSDALRDPLESKQKLRAALVLMAKNGFINTLWEQSQVQGDYTANFSQSQKFPVEFNVAGTTYGRDQSGWHIVKYGIPWFGAGKIMGKDITVAMQSAVSTDMTMSQSSGSDMGSRAQSDSRGEAGIR